MTPNGGGGLQGTSVDVALMLMLYGVAKVCFGVAEIIRALKGGPVTKR